MTWIDSNGDVRPQSWEEYCEMVRNAPDWPSTQRLMRMGYRPPANKRQRALRMRQQLFRAHPYCFWCGREVKIGASHSQPEGATVDHLYSRLHPERKSRHEQKGAVLHVLACYSCNHERGLCEQQQRPFIPKLKERLEHAQLADATLAKDAASRAKSKQKPQAICTVEEAIHFARKNPSR